MKWKFFLIISSAFFTWLLLMQPGDQASGNGQDSSIGYANNDNSELTDPPWFGQPGWHYRRPIIITNNGEKDWIWYQVLVRLDDSNFNFNQANNDGSDLRFAMEEGTIPIPFWIEYWDSQDQLAYIWVKVPYVMRGDRKIYMYYDNPSASHASDGDSTFDGFEDDWEQFSPPEIYTPDPERDYGNAGSIQSPLSWTIIEGTPTVSPEGYLILGNGTGIESEATFQHQAVGFKANFGPGSGNEWIGFYDETTKRVMIGDRTSDPTKLYLRNFDTVEITSRIGDVDWHGQNHIFEARWCIQTINCDQTKTMADVDHGIMGTFLTNQVPTTQLPVTLHNDNSGAASTLQVDWVYVRQFSNYDNSEPTVALGAEQGLVELEIKILDSPDPIPTGEALTYQLTISNTAEIDAPGVVVTDTLPTDVQIGEISASQGSCSVVGDIICELNTVPANSMATITLVVTPTLDGVITNAAEVDSPGFELNFSNNTIQQSTLVDSVPPVLNWEKPVQNGGTSTTYGGPVILEASATDNDQVAWVEFLLWDHLCNPPDGCYVSLGIANSYPYQIAFNSEVLILNESYQLFVLGSDRAGNRSNPFNPLQRIYIERRTSVFLPLMVK